MNWSLAPTVSPLAFYIGFIGLIIVSMVYELVAIFTMVIPTCLHSTVVSVCNNTIVASEWVLLQAYPIVLPCWGNM